MPLQILSFFSNSQNFTKKNASSNNFLSFVKFELRKQWEFARYFDKKA